MNTFKIGDVIRKTRLELGITQEQLSEGICSVSSLSKIENNSQVPTKANFDALMQRMGKSGEMYYAFVSERDYEIQEMKCQIRYKVINKEYDEADQLISILEKEVEANENLNKQFILYTKAIIKKNKGEKLESVLDLFYDAIKIINPNFNIRKLSNYLLTDDEVRIINNIAITYHAMNESRIAIRLLYDLKEYIEERYKDTTSKEELLPMILYNLSKWLGLEKRYDEAIEICDMGIEACIRYNKLRYFGEIIFNKAYDLFEIGKKEKSFECLKQTYYIFLAENNMRYVSIVNTYTKDKFGICIDEH